jgi:murein DD-endopeptidase MepM/ murein hydrolase activator NlpD
LINDLYFKGIIQVTGKKLLDEHRKYISELYIKKINLERQEQDLKTLRKQAVIEQKILQDKKNFKENLLQESKGQQIYYEKYLEAKLKQEQDLKLKAITEQLRLTTTRTNILEKYNCEYLDLSKNTVEARIMQMKNPRCYAINRIIVSENELQNKSETGARVPNPLLWPVNPVQGISAFYRDQEYKETFGAEHYAIDIKVPQGTDVSAPMD